MARRWLSFLAVATFTQLASGLPTPPQHFDSAELWAQMRLARRDSASASGPNCTIPTQWMTQKLDHTNASETRTWQQQYQLVTDYYKEGGPILMFQGEETTVMTCLESTVILSWAQQTGGIAATIEHRYFGQSLPLGSASETVSGLQYLTLPNIIGDAEEFVSQIKANVSGAEKAKVGVASGSYGGFLMVMFRQNSDVFDGVVASASPVRALGITPNNPARYAWWDFVAEVYLNKSTEASSKLHAGLVALNETFNNDPASLVPALNLCAAPQAGLPAAAYITSVSGIAMLYAEFNYAGVHPERAPMANSLDVIVDAIMQVPDEQPLQVINTTLWNWYGRLGGFSCIDPVANFSAATAIVETFPFAYLTCTVVPINAEDISPDNPVFIPGLTLESTKLAGCKSSYGLTSVPSEADLQAKYNFTPEDLEQSTGILFVQAGYDPTTAISVPANFTDTNSDVAYRSQRLYVANMGHREDLFAPADGDRDEVVALRKTEIDTLSAWFAL